VRDNPLQFAVVREDPRVESLLVEGARRALVVASGGCTALSLAALHPELEVAIFDVNAAQLEHVEKKRQALARGDVRELVALGSAGNFESLFAGLRSFLTDLCVGAGELEALFHDPGRLAQVRELFERKYWAVAFDLFFADPLLRAMFGPEAIQHAPNGSYPRYFQAAFERGLTRADAFDNYFLHHVFLGGYLDRAAAWPPYFGARGRALPRFRAVHGPLEAVPDLERFDVVSLSNLFDWMSPADAERTARLLGERLAPGATAIVRQLNSRFDVGSLFGDRFDADDALARELLASDRSLFYSRLWIGRRRR
jgi:S-adenosylmethionine-diacylglycerol 3-amino-3-carboxypropyl transferase